MGVVSLAPLRVKSAWLLVWVFDVAVHAQPAWCAGGGRYG
jgi:hypothetical protein